MVTTQRGIDKKLLDKCPHCKSKKIIKNGHHYGGKLQYLCKTCSKHFTEDVIKGYPTSNIPFPLISYFLYFRRKIPEFSNMRKFRKFVNFWLQYLKVSDIDVSRQTIHHWINNYDVFLDEVISFSESKNFIQQKISKVVPIPAHNPIPYGTALNVLEKKFGKKYCVNLTRHDPVFFQELVDIVSKHGVFSWEFSRRDFEFDNLEHRSITGGQWSRT
jgi:hypothetical protein